MNYDVLKQLGTSAPPLDWKAILGTIFPGDVADRYAKLFIQNDIDGRVADMITPEVMQEIGIASIGHRLLIQKAIHLINNKPSSKSSSSHSSDVSPASTLSSTPQIFLVSESSRHAISPLPSSRGGSLPEVNSASLASTASSLSSDSSPILAPVLPVLANPAVEKPMEPIDRKNKKKKDKSRKRSVSVPAVSVRRTPSRLENLCLQVFHHRTKALVENGVFRRLLAALQRERESSAISQRLRLLGNALSRMMYLESLRLATIRDLGAETLISWAMSGVVRVHRELSWDREVEPLHKTKIGWGGTALIYKARFEGQEVALKVLNDDDEESQKACITEVSYQSICHHPNIIRCYGGCTRGSTLCAMMEYCSRSSLFEVLRDRTIDLAWPLRLNIAIGAAAAIDYLHSLKVVHRDVKSLNILITHDFVAKITDFGTSRLITKKMTGLVGSPVWMAPEVIQSKQYSEKADVYSFGIVLWELLEKALPYADVPRGQLEQFVLEKKRPPVPDYCPESYSKLMQACWGNNPKKRPTIKQVKDSLESMARGASMLNLFDQGEMAVSPRAPHPLQGKMAEKVEKARRRMSDDLNQMEKALILTSWRKLEPKSEGLAGLMYQRLFELAPSVKPLFDHVPAKRQGRKVMKVVEFVVKALDTQLSNEVEAEKAQKTLYELGQRHLSYGARPEHLSTFSEAFLWALGHETMLGSDFISQQSVWAKGLRLAGEIVVEGMEAAAKGETSPYKPSRSCSVQ